MRRLIIVLVIVLLLPVIAIVQLAQPSLIPAAAGEVLQSDKERITSPDVSSSERTLLWSKETVPSPSTFIRRLEKKRVIFSILPIASHWRWP